MGNYEERIAGGMGNKENKGDRTIDGGMTEYYSNGHGHGHAHINSHVMVANGHPRLCQVLKKGSQAHRPTAPTQAALPVREESTYARTRAHTFLSLVDGKGTESKRSFEFRSGSKFSLPH